MAHAVRRILLERSLIDEDQLRRVEGWYELLDRGLVEKGWRSGLLADTDLHGILLEQGAEDGTAMLEAAAPPDAALGALSRELAERHRALPLSVNPNEVVFGMLDPFDNVALKQIRAFSFLPIRVVAVRASVLFPALTKAYDVEVIVPEDGSQFRDPPADDDAPKLERFAPADSAPAPKPAAPKPTAPKPAAPASVSNSGVVTSEIAPAPVESATSSVTTGEIEAKSLADAAFPSDENAPLPGPNDAVAERPLPEVPPPAVEVPTPPPAVEVPTPPPAVEVPTPPPAVEVPTPPPVVEAPTPPPVVEVPTPPPAVVEPVVAPTTPIQFSPLPATPPWSHASSAAAASPPPASFESKEDLCRHFLAELVPPFRTAAVLGIEEKSAVGWDGVGTHLTSETTKEISLSLSTPSAFQRAWEWGMVAAGSKLEPSRVERSLFNALGDNAPSTFAVFPIRGGGEKPIALLYVDVESGLLDESIISVARRVSEAVSEAMTELAKAGKL